jgi:metal-responsive CopG/Arc/MetJ family transcriptional regulator
MATIQVVLEEDLLKAADRAARRLGKNRSALIRDAVRAHLKQLRAQQDEERDRAGYARFPDHEFGVWDGVAAWPED